MKKFLSFLFLVTFFILFQIEANNIQDKKPSFYVKNQENIVYEDAINFFDVIYNDYPYLIPFFDNAKSWDIANKLETYNFGNVGTLSTISISNLKVVGDLKKEFGDLSQMNILEIGGNGSLCKLLHDLYGFSTYTFFDTPKNHEKIISNLSPFKLKNVFHINNKQNNSKNYDLVICNFSFSDLSNDEQKFVNKIFSNTLNGYIKININTIVEKDKKRPIENTLTVIKHIKKRKTKIISNNPLINADDLLLIWKNS